MKKKKLKKNLSSTFLFATKVDYTKTYFLITAIYPKVAVSFVKVHRGVCFSASFFFSNLLPRISEGQLFILRIMVLLVHNGLNLVRGELCVGEHSSGGWCLLSNRMEDAQCSVDSFFFPCGCWGYFVHFFFAPQASISHFSFYLVDTFLLPFMCILAFCFSLLFCFAFYWHYETLCSSGAEAFFGLVNMESCNYICICGWG